LSSCIGVGFFVLFIGAVSVWDAATVLVSAMVVLFAPGRDGDPQTECDQRHAGSGVDHRSVAFGGRSAGNPYDSADRISCLSR
jgi:hypothetical protein